MKGRAESTKSMHIMKLSFFLIFLSVYTCKKFSVQNSIINNEIQYDCNHTLNSLSFFFLKYVNHIQEVLNNGYILFHKLLRLFYLILKVFPGDKRASESTGPLDFAFEAILTSSISENPIFYKNRDFRSRQNI